MFCRNCGAQIPDGSAFCRNCGQRVADGSSEPASVPPASQPVVQSQPMPARRKRRSGAVVAIAIVAVVAIVAAAGAGLYFSGALNGILGRVSVPDVVGEKPYDALQDLRSASDAWQVAFLDEGGQIVEVTDEFSYQFYEVSSVSPEPGSVLNAADESQGVAVTLAKTQRQLEREQLIQEAIDREPLNDVTIESCSDQGCYVEFTFTMGVDARRWEWCYDDGAGDPSVDYYQDLANQLGTSVVSSIYSEDGTLVALYTSVRGEAAGEEASRTRDRAQQIQDDAKQSAHDSADDLLSQLCPYIAQTDTDLLQDSLSSLGASGSGEVTVSYELDDTSVRITERGDFDGSAWPTKLSRDGSGRVYEHTADFLTACTDRSVEYTIVNNKGDVLFSYSAPAGSYDPVITE